MKNFSPLVRGLVFLSLLGLGRLGAATATFPTPVDANSDGVIESAEIQTALNAASGLVFLPAANTYHIDAPLTIDTRNGVSLVGEGATTVLTITADIEAIVITNGTGCGVRHLKLVGPSGHTHNAIRISGGNEHFLEDITIANAHRGIELVNGIGPTLVNIALSGLTGDYGIKIDAATGKVDAAQLHGITGSASAASVEWLLFGRVDGVELQAATLSGGKRGIRCLGSVGPKYVYTNQVTISSCTNEGILVETGSDLLVNATSISQTGASGFAIASTFTGGAVLTDLDVSNAAGHGLEINGGRDIGVLEPTINATGSALPAGTGAGIYLAAGCSYVSVTDGSVVGQHYGVYFAGTSAQSDSQDVKMKNVATTGNAVPFAPGNLEGAPDVVPSGVTALAGNAQVTLSWTAVSGATSYHVKRATVSGGPYTTIASPTTTTCSDTGLTNGTDYYYVVSAVGGGESANSAEVVATPQALTIIKDNADTTGITKVGTWTTSTVTAGYYGTNYLQDGNAGGGKSVTFTPTITVAGNYAVYVRWTAGGNRATNAPVDVNAAGGTTSFSVNQQLNNGTWVLLGTFFFDAGTTGNVTVGDTGANGYVVADAVEFILQ